MFHSLEYKIIEANGLHKRYKNIYKYNTIQESSVRQDKTSAQKA